jgi:peptidoglycan hydrolase-like protein with peptidoglycan-binding domain
MSQLDYIVSECNKRASGVAPVPSSVAPVAPAKPKLVGMLRRGSTGANVRYLQAALGGLKVDGQFGPITDKAVRAFQASQGLKVDGIVGPITWGKL